MYGNNGIIKAVLSEAGGTALSREQLTISVIIGSRIGKPTVRTDAGKGSRAQVLTLADLKSQEHSSVTEASNDR